MPKGIKGSGPKEAPKILGELASIKHVEPETRQELIDRIAGLEAALAAKDEALSEAQKATLAAVEAQGAFFPDVVEEKPTGKTRITQRVERYKRVGHHDDGRPIMEPVFRDEEVPTYWYKVDLPPSGGEHIRINGREIYHGSVAEFDIDELRTVKDIVFRCWKHEHEIRGSNENAYRKPQRPQISARNM